MTTSSIDRPDRPRRPLSPWVPYLLAWMITIAGFGVAGPGLAYLLGVFGGAR